MEWNIINKLIEFDAIWTTAIALLLLLLGYGLRKKITFLETYCIPAPVIGGILMALVLLVLHHSGGGNGIGIKFTPALQAPLMLAFFTTIGLGGSLQSLKKGGKILIIYLLFCWSLAVFQNTFGSLLAYLMGIHPMFGVMAGAVSLEGGHGAAASFGPVAESFGVTGATTVAIASATFGLMAGGFLGGPLAFALIKKHKLQIKTSANDLYKKGLEDTEEKKPFTHREFLNMLAIVFVVMAIGTMLSDGFSKMITESTGKTFVLPGYVGAMFVAIILRNLNDAFKIIKLNDDVIDLMANVSIGIFLTMAMMTLKIWELYDLAVPLIVILVLQVIAIVLIAYFLLFRALGKDYDAAVICSGFVGHGLGATPNAVANMGAVCERYKTFSHKAFLIVPLSGAVLIDIVAIPCITWFVNFFGTM